MKALSIGGGAREHAIVKALAQSNAEIFAVMKNRNPGIVGLSKDVLYEKETETKRIAEWAKSIGIDIAVIGPEAPLGEGIVNALEEAGVPAVGPTQNAARIEISKEFMRNLLKKHNVPGNLDYRIFDDITDLKEFLIDYDKEVVVKPIGLTGGKGVKVMGEHLLGKEDVIKYCEQIISNKIGGSSKFVIEERAIGEEFTLQTFCDGEHVIPMPAVQDHKRAYEGDKGPNTGGMGSYSQEDGLLPFLKREEYDEAVNIIQKIIDAMKDEGAPYKGFLYGQFMLTKHEPKIIECNARFGDPEAMNVLPLLKSDFFELCWGIVDGTLSSKKADFDNKATVCKYVVPKGYGVKSLVGEKVIVDKHGIEKIGAELFYASVNEKEGQIYTTSSRSMAVVGIENSIKEAERIAESALSHVKGNVFMRHDIGKEELIARKIEHMKELRT